MSLIPTHDSSPAVPRTIEDVQTLFFPGATRLCALPNWQQPRLLFSYGSPRDRWAATAMYPAQRTSARAYRLALRLRNVLVPGGVTTPGGEGYWPLADVISDVLPGAASLVVLAGTPGPAQKFTAQVRGSHGRVLGYVKYGDAPAACRRIEQEFRVLDQLDGNVAPAALKFARWAGGLALVTRPLLGRPPGNALPPPDALVSLCAELIGDVELPIDEHPWSRTATDRIPNAESRLKALRKREWPVAVQHGDLVPWNLLRTDRGTFSAIDWEYGRMQSLPYLDIAYYFLQVGFLIHRWSPQRALSRTTAFLEGHPRIGLSPTEARAIVELAAGDAYANSVEDGHGHDFPIQKWRRALLGDD